MWHFPLQNYNLDVPSESWHPGSFGFKRKFDYHHTGIDLYAEHGDPVFAVEDGVVVAIEDFTGEINDTPWWNNTWAVLVVGKSGVVAYGEILPNVEIGSVVKAGQQIGTILTVLKELQVKSWIPGHSRSMLHFELHTYGTRQTSWWKLNDTKPSSLLDPTINLKSALRFRRIMALMKKIILVFFCLCLIACKTTQNSNQVFYANPDDVAVIAPSSSEDGVQSSTTAAVCPDDMIHVEGDFCPNVDENCLRWDQPGGMRCLEFAPSRCLSTRRIHMSFCMDVYEWPNREGEYPETMMSWYQAQRNCESVGKRLCHSREWTFACEGPDMNPYPYGDHLHRDRSVCRIDHQTVVPNRPLLASPNPNTRNTELRRIYEAVTSGELNQCVSWAGIHDMTGNVDEWVINDSHHPYNSGLKGGWWGPVRTRCRPMTTAHNEGFTYYNIGTRCCRTPE